MDRVVPIAPVKIEQIREAGKKQLPPEEYEKLLRLILDLQIHGLTPYINAELGKIMAKIQWGLEISESPEWAAALIECDRTFLGYELRDMFLEMGVEPPYGHKKELCRKLYMMGHPQVVAIMEPLIGPAMVAAPAPLPPAPAAPPTPPLAKEDWQLRETIADTVYGLEHGVKEEDIRKHLTRNPQGKYWYEPGDVDFIIREAKKRMSQPTPPSPAKPKEVVYKPPYQPKLRLTLEQAKERLEGLKQETALTDRRLEKLRETQRKNPEWKSYDEYAQDYVGIDIRIEEQQAVKELYDEEIASLQKAIEGG